MKRANPGFSKLLERYRQGECSEEEESVVDQWFNSIHHEIADQPIEETRDAIMTRMWANIQSASHSEGGVVPMAASGKWWQMWPVRIAAACLFVLIGIAVYQSVIKNGHGSVVEAGRDISRLTELANNGSVVKKVILPDESIVELDPGSSVLYGADFGSTKREVVLTGSGFFQVSHNRQKPFHVLAGRIVTRVVGTSFTIRNHTESLEVAVLTGKVIVEKLGNTSENEGVVLTPNQKVTYSQEKDHFVTSLVNQPALVTTHTNTTSGAVFNFDDTPLSDVVSVLEAAYGIKIVVTNEQIKSCPVKADLGQQPLFTKLDIVCAALDAHYDTKGTTIIITGGHCE